MWWGRSRENYNKHLFSFANNKIVDITKKKRLNLAYR